MTISTFRLKFDKLVWSTMLETRFGRPGRWLAIVLRYIVAMLRDMFQGQLAMRSMSLVYTTLLSIVPLIAFSFSVLKGLGLHNELEPQLFKLLEPLGPQGAEITQKIIGFVNNVRGGVLGGVSLAIFIYSAIAMVQKVEESFNYVWYVGTPRSFARRFTEYTIVLLIGPVVIAIALGMIASLRSNTIVQYLLQQELLGPVFVATSKLIPYLLVSAVFTFVYKFMPNTTVHFRSALLGGLAGGIIWATISMFFATFVAYSTTKLLVYSGFAVAFTALIWLYLNWLVLLIGSQLAFYHQNPAFLRIGRQEPRLSNAMRERLALNIMFLVGRAFRKGQPFQTTNALAESLRIPSIAVQPIIAGLEADSLLTTGENEELLPAREMSRMRLKDILAVVRERGETGSYRNPAWTPEITALGKQLDAAVNTAVADKTLADLLDETEPD